MLYGSNMTIEEHLRYNGEIPKDKLDELFDSQAKLQGLSGVDAHMSEAMAQYPAEDFLSDAISRLQTLAKNLRGGNKDTLNGIIESLEDVAQCTFNAADYGRDELRKALAFFKES